MSQTQNESHALSFINLFKCTHEVPPMYKESPEVPPKNFQIKLQAFLATILNCIWLHSFPAGCMPTMQITYKKAFVIAQTKNLDKQTNSS